MCGAQAVVLTERHSPTAAAELCAAARARLPHSTALGDRALALAAARGTLTNPRPLGGLNVFSPGKA